MSKVTYGQRGYIGSSMSVNAMAAYEDDEMPQSRWTKAAIVAAIKSFCDEDDRVYDPAIEKMKKADLWDAFIEWRSWHHTSKFANATDFYGINEDSCRERFQLMTDRQLAEREAMREAQRKAERERCEAEEEAKREMEREEQRETAKKKAALGPAYEYIASMNPVFTPVQTIVRTMAADEAVHPERYEVRVAKSGRVMLRRRASGVEMPVKRACTYEIL